MEANHKVVLEEGQGEIVEKKSRFIAHVYCVHSEEEAVKRIDEAKKRYWDARHNCYAYIIGKKNAIQRYSDDGEPGGTAGKPILEVLLGENMSDCLVVVTRYFGGTLLGTGGLVRAYQQAAKEGLANSVTAEKITGRELSFITDYNTVGKIQYLIGNEEGRAVILDTVYTDTVEMKILCREECVRELCKKITEAANGRGTMELGETGEFAVVDGKARLL
ncbi:MAG: YigZ family protein [Alistipes sp.]|nr:YigZ family protein [Alistipes sp.]